MYSKLAGGGADYDIIIPSDYMISRMIEEGMLAELNFDNIPNFQYVDQQFRDPASDPGSKYSEMCIRDRNFPATILFCLQQL